MGTIGKYLLSVVSVALLVSISNTLVKKGSAVATVAKLLSGLVLTIAIVSPWTDLRITDFTSLNAGAEIEAASLALKGKEAAHKELTASIKTQLCSYTIRRCCIVITNNSQGTIFHIHGRIPCSLPKGIISITKDFFCKPLSIIIFAIAFIKIIFE